MRAWNGQIPDAGVIDSRRIAARVARGDLLDLHAAGGGGDHRLAPERAVDREGEEELAGDRHLLLDEDGLDRVALGAALDR